MKTNDIIAEGEPGTPGNLHRDKALLPNLDGIRAVACLLVVLNHSPAPMPIRLMGEIGVGLFFVLSGFLMSYLYAQASWNVKAVSLYCIARFSRIAPIYWLVITICIAISYVTNDSEFDMRIMGLTQIMRHYLFGGSVGIFWSISPEIQYYIFFLFIWFTIAHRAMKSYLLPLLAFTCAGFLLTHNYWPGLTLPHKLHFFLAGTIAGALPRAQWILPIEKNILPFLQVGAIILLIAPAFFYATIIEFYKVTELGIVYAVAVYLLSLPTRWTTFAFASPVMRRIGQASFSIYLMHVLVFYFGQSFLGLSNTTYEPLWILLILAGVVLPMIASRYIEIPLQKMTRKFLLRCLQPWLLRKQFEVVPV